MTDNNYKQIVHRFFTRSYDNIPFQIRSTGHYKVSGKSFDGRIRKNFIELFWCIEGEGAFVIDSKTYILHPGEVCFYTVGDLHHVSAVTDVFHYRWMTFDGPAAVQIWNGLKISKTPRHVGTCPEELFCRLIAEIQDYSTDGLKKASATAFNILMLASSTKKASSAEYDYIKQAKQIIDAQYRNCDFNIGALAEALQINRSQLCRKFKQAHGVSPVEYLINCRIQHGLDLLEHSKKKIKDIAYSSGFSSPNYFSKMIKKYTGIPVKKLRH